MSNIGLIVSSQRPEALQKAREMLLQHHAENEVTAELPIIDGFAVEVDPTTLALLPELGRLSSDLQVVPDVEVELPPQPAAPPSARLDTARETLHVDQVWDQGYRGRGVGIAIIDTGIAPHPDLADRLVAFKDCINDRAEAYDDHGHGTHVAGIAAGSGSRNARFRGIAPEASIVGIKVLNEKGKGKSSDIVEGIQWAVDNRRQYNIRAINISIGGKAWIGWRWDSMARAANRAAEQGIVVAIAAGNSGPDGKTIETPGIAPEPITVANLDDNWSSERGDDDINQSSSRGPTRGDDPKPDVAAPGTWITACNTSDGYTTMTGTSMASPMVAGTAALLAQARPDLHGSRIKDVLMRTAAPLASETSTSQGRGMIDPPVALAAVKALPQERFDVS